VERFKKIEHMIDYVLKSFIVEENRESIVEVIENQARGDCETMSPYN